MEPFFLQVLLSPPIVVYSPRVLPVYVYDAHADCGKNVRFVKRPLYFLSHLSLSKKKFLISLASTFLNLSLKCSIFADNMGCTVGLDNLFILMPVKLIA